MEITTILPIHEYNDCVLNALKSFEEASNVKKSNLIVVTTNDVKAKLPENFDCTYLIVEDSESTSFSHLVNKAVDCVETEYFSILEMDDWFRKNVFLNAEKYFNSGIEASVFLTLTEVYDDKDKDTVGYMNEAVLASSFSDELGYLDFQCTEDYPNFNFTGAIFNTEDFKSLGKLKESMKIHFWHEFALRCLHKGKKIYVIPKVGYVHTINRDDSYYSEISKTVSEKELDFWFDTAKKEYFYKNDRKKEFEE